MRLYIGNATKQNQAFMYWVDGIKSPRTQNIPIGGQIAISGDLTSEQIDGIIQQHAKYGLVDIKEASNVRNFVGVCYSIDKPISALQLQKLMTHNTIVLVERGKEIRKELAVASNQVLEDSVHEAGRPERLRQLDMSVVEEDRADRAEGAAQFAEGFRVIPGGNDGRPPPAVRRNRRRRAA